jgi:flagellar basal-body rod protein FlgG
MIRALWTAATGMEAQQLNIDVVSNNLANVNTTGFKKSRVDFQDLLYQTLQPAGTSQAQGAQVPTGVQVGLGTQYAATHKIFTQGDYQASDDPLDMVIEGDGFFQVTQPSGAVAYTRDGTFKKDSSGRIVTADGFALDPQITIPQDAVDVFVGYDGTVSSKMADGSTQELGKITLAKFANPSGLENVGRNLLAKTAASGEPIVDAPGSSGIGSILSKYLEMSNVKVVEEMVNMIVAQRAYEVNSKAIQTADEMLNIANNLRR